MQTIDKAGLFFTIGLDDSRLKSDAERAKSEFRSITQSIEREGKQIDDVYKGIRKSMINFGLTASFAQMARELYSFASSFEDAMKEVSTISKDVAGNLDEYKDKILDLTMQVPIAADQASRALYQIVSAGHDGADALEILRVSAQAAVGGVTETATSADAITTLLNAYQQSASEAQHISDLLFTTVRLGKTTMGELGQSIAQVAPLAASSGIAMQEVLSAVATLTKSGTPTAQAMTQIRAAITGVNKELGDGAFKGRTLQEAFAIVAERAGGSQTKMQELLGTIEAVNGVLGVTGIHAKTAAEDLQQMNNVAGASAQAFDLMSQTSSNQFIILKNNILKSFGNIGDSMVDASADITKALNDAFATGKIETFIEVLKVAIATYGTWRAARLAENAIRNSSNRLLAERDAIFAKRDALKAEVDAIKANRIAMVRNQIELKKSIALQRQAVAQAMIQAKASGTVADMKKAEALQTQLNTDIQKANNLTTQRQIITKELEAKQTALSTAAKEADTVATAANGRLTTILSAAKLKLINVLRSLYATMMSNPYTLILTAVVALGYAIYKLITYESDLEKQQKKLNELAAEGVAQESVATLKFQEKWKAIKDLKEGTYEYKDAIRDLIKNNNDLFGNINAETVAILNQKDAYNELVKAIKNKIDLQTKEATVKYLSDDIQEHIAKTIASVREDLEDIYGAGDPQVVERFNRLRPYIYGDEELPLWKLPHIYSIVTQDAGDKSGLKLGVNADQIKGVLYAHALYMQNSKKLLSDTYKESEKLNEIQTAPTTTDGQKVNAPTVKDQIADLKKRIEQARKNISELRKDSSTATAEAINTEQQKLDDLEKQLKTFTDEKTKKERRYITDNADELTKLSVELINRQAQADVDAMQDGLGKKLAQLDLDHKAELDALAQKRKDLDAIGKKSKRLDTSKQLKQINDAELAENKRYNAEVVKLKNENRRQIAEILDQAHSHFSSDLQARLSQINNYYDAEIRKAQQAGATKEQIYKLDELRLRERQNAHSQNRINDLQFNERIADVAIQNSNGYLFESDKKLASSLLRLNTLKKIEDELKLQQANGLDVTKDLLQVHSEMQKIQKDIDSFHVDKVKETAGVLSSLLKSFSTVYSQKGNVKEWLSLFSSLGDIINDLSETYRLLQSGKGVFSALQVGVSSAINLYNLYAQQAEENLNAERKYQDAIKETNHLLQLARITAKEYQESNIWAVDNPYAKAIALANQYAESMKVLNENYKQLEAGQIQVGTKKVISGKNIVKGALSGAGGGAAIGAAIGSVVPVVGTVLGGIIGSIFGGLAGGVAGAVNKKVVPVMENLQKRFGQILKNGTDTFELNPEIIANYNKLDEATKKIVDNWKEIRQKALDAQQQMLESFKGLTSSLSDDLSSSLSDAFKADDINLGIKHFSDRMDIMIANITKKILFSKFFKADLDNLVESMKNSFGRGGDNDITDDITRAKEDIIPKIAPFLKASKEVSELIAKAEADLQNAGSRQASSKGIAQASQDSINELSGRITAIQTFTHRIDETNKLIQTNTANMLRHISNIDTNTSRLQSIEDNMQRMRVTLDDISTKGLKMR